MPDREKVIRGLECCVAYDYKCNDCPYQDDGGAGDGCYSDELKTDALALLKAQEPHVLTLEEYKAWMDIPFQERDPIFHEMKLRRGSVTGWTNTADCCVENYGKTARCWTSRPDEKRRAETPWES